ncbi:hypothetical protein HYDPIDRAFT_44747 [Hydnomerulius pinastri MD-312]|uniref:Uncharacterized protein n=1 Tax=Hydnomerulius pinastri MD-312 TaxID=994086 RepID=A0A0C9VK42_9AGAM|nr:hypothetical protein HYDPIDRAFT_44747 [Hydnomerulius pinastri MD-312]
MRMWHYREVGARTPYVCYDFDNTLLTTHPSEDLREEDARLRKLAEMTVSDYKLGRYGPISEKNKMDG